jgi:hypothetical protein
VETSYSNKPYFFVPLAERANRRKALNRQDMLAAGTRMGILAVSIECMTPLHFGSGQLSFEEAAKRFSHSLLRENNQIALPGSSFKGMLRSVFEAVSASCLLTSPRSLPMMTGALSACTGSSGLCPACSVFGRLSYKGKLTISSFYSDTEPVILRIPQLEQPFRTYPRPARGERDPRTGNERLYYGKFRDINGIKVAGISKSDFLALKKREPQSGGNFYGRKFYKHSGNWKTLAESSGRGNYECLPVGSVLNGKITYQGLAEDELGALLFALGLGWEQPIFHKLGYAKPAFFGSVTLKVEPKALPRYEDEPMTTAEAEKIAKRYYEKHKPSIAAAVHALEQEWKEIGDSKWMLNDGRYGY